MRKKCILFLRVSTISQDPTQQIESLKRDAMRDGFNEDDIIIIAKHESARSLAEEDRQGLNELKDYISRGDIDSIYIFEVSRIARTQTVLHSIRQLVLNEHIQLVCHEPSFKLLTDDRTQPRQEADIIFSLLGVMSESEMRIKLERFAKARELQAKENKFNGGAVPFGYTHLDKKEGGFIIIDEIQAEIVRRVYSLYESGLSQGNVCLTIRREYPDVVVNFTQINNILKNEIYTGKTRPRHIVRRKNKDGKIVESIRYERTYPKIISEEQFTKCREIAKQNHFAPKSKTIYFAKDLLRCPRCGGRWGASKSINTYYCCNSHNTQREVYRYGKMDCDYRHTIGINTLDSILWHDASKEEARYLLQDKKEAKEKLLDRQKQQEKALLQIKKEKETKEKKQDRIFELYIDGAYSKEKKDIQLAKVAADLEVVRAEELRIKGNLRQIQETIKGIEDAIVFKSEIEGLPAKSDIIFELTDEAKFKLTLTNIRKQEDPNEIYRIIHNHISRVFVHTQEERMISQKGREVKVLLKTIEIYHTNDDKISRYYTLSYYPGKVFSKSPITHPQSQCNMLMLERFYDKRRDRRKEVNAEKSKKFKEQFLGFYTPKQVSELLGLSMKQVYSTFRKEVEPSKIGKFVVFPEKDVLAYKKKQEESSLLSTSEVAKLLGVPTYYVHNYIAAKSLKAIKVGGFWRVEKNDVDEYKKSLKRKEIAKKAKKNATQK